MKKILANILIWFLVFQNFPSAVLASTLASDVNFDTVTVDSSGSLVTAGYGMTVAGDVSISGSLDASAGAGGTSLISVGGSWTNSGGVFTPGVSSVTMTASLTTTTVTANASAGTFYNLLFNSSTGGWTLQDNLAANGTVTVLNSDINGNGVNFNNNAVNVTGDFIASGGKITAGAATMTLGANWLSGAGSFAAGTSTEVFTASATNRAISSGTIAFGDLVFKASTGSWQLSDNLTCRTIKVNSGTFVDAGKSVAVNGTIDFSATGNSSLVQSSGSWFITANGDLKNIADDSKNRLNYLKVNDNLTVSKAAGQFNSKILVLGANALLNGANGYYLEGCDINDPLTISAGADIQNGGLFFYPKSGVTINQQAFTLGNSLYIGMTDTATVNMTGNWTVGGQMYVRGGYNSTDLASAFVLNTGTYNLATSGISVSFASGAYPTRYFGKIAFGSGTHTIAGLFTGPGTQYSWGWVDFGTSTVSVTGNMNLSRTTVSGSTSTLVFSGSAAQTFTTNTQTFYNIVVNNSGAGAAGAVTVSQPLDVNGGLTVARGTLSLSGSSTVTLANGLNIASTGSVDVTGYTGTWTYDGSGTLIDARPILVNLGTFTVDGNSAVLTLGSNAKAAKITVGADDNINLGAGGYNLELTDPNTPLTVNNAAGFDKGTNSTVTYEAGGSATVSIPTLAYNNLTFTPSTGTGAFYLTGNLTGANAVAGNLLISNPATLDVTSNNYGLEVQGNWTNNGAFVAQSGSVVLSATAVGKTVTSGGSGTFYNLVFNGAGGGWTLQDALTATNTFTILNTDTTGNGLDLNNKALSVSGNFIASGGKVTAGSSSVVIGQSWNTSGTNLNAGTSSVNMIASYTGATLRSGSNTFYNLTFNNTTGSWSLLDDLAANRTFTVLRTIGSGVMSNDHALNIMYDLILGTQGTIKAGSSTITVGRNWDSSDGNFIYGSSSVNLTGTGNVKNNSGFYNLVAAFPNQTNTLTASADIYNVLTLGTGTISTAYRFRLYGSGIPFVNNGFTFTGSGYIYYSPLLTGVTTITPGDYGTSTQILLYTGAANTTFNFGGDIILNSGVLEYSTFTGRPNSVLNTQNYNLYAKGMQFAGVGPSYNGPFTVNLGNSSISLGTSGFTFQSLIAGNSTLNLNSATITVAGPWQLTEQGGDVYQTTENSTVVFTNTSSQIITTSATTQFYNIVHTGSAPLTLASNSLVVTGDLVQSGTGSIVLASLPLAVSGSVNLTGGILAAGAATISLGGDWTVNGGVFTRNTSTVNFNKASGTQTLNPGTQTFNNFVHTGAGVLSLSTNSLYVANNFTNDASAGGINLNDQKLAVDGAITLAGGTFTQGTGTVTALGGVTLGATASWNNISTGGLTLGGNVSNAGTILFDANGLGGGGADSIVIQSNVTGSQRNWQSTGAGIFSMTDVAVHDQTVIGGSPANIIVLSGTSLGNNINWVFGTNTLSGILYDAINGTGMSGKSIRNSIAGALGTDVQTTAADGSFTIGTDVTLAGNDTIALYVVGDANTKASTVTKIASGVNLTGVNLFKDFTTLRNEPGINSLANTDLVIAANTGSADLLVSTNGSTIAFNRGLYIPPGYSYTPGSNLLVGGTWTNSGTFTPGATSITLNATNTGNNISSGTGTFYDIVFNSAGGGWTLQDTLAASNTLTVLNSDISGNGVDLNNKAVNITNDFIATGGKVTAGSATMQIGGNWLSSTGSFAAGTSTQAFTATNTGHTITSGTIAFGTLWFNSTGGQWTIQDDLVAKNFLLNAGTFVDNAKYLTVYGTISMTGTTLTSTGTWTQAASGSIRNSSKWNSFHDLRIAGSNLTTTLAGSLFVGFPTPGYLTLGSGTLNGANRYVTFYPTTDGLTVNNLTMSSLLSGFEMQVTSDITQKAITLPNNFSPSVGFYLGANMTATGNFTFGNASIYFTTETSTPAHYLNMDQFNFTAGSLWLGRNSAATCGYVKLGSGINSFYNIYRYANNTNTKHLLDLGSSTTAVTGTIDFTGFNIVQGTSSITMTASTTGQTIRMASQTFNNLTFNSGTGGWIIQDTVQAAGTFFVGNSVLSAGKGVDLNGKTIVIGGNYNQTGGQVINGASDIYLSGDWANSATFNAGTGSVILIGAASQSITTGGAGTFNTLAIANPTTITFADAFKTGILLVNSSTLSAGPTLQFKNGATHTVSAALAIAGTQLKPIILASTAGGSTWYIAAPASTITYVKVSDADAATNSIRAKKSKNLGNNDNKKPAPHWIFDLGNALWHGVNF
ncbi:MAG: hypothetical protein HQL23_08490 [Candidatus Omnitrophica bacterium]|nr:hypothetical protein [Candidatus Omnitrophota bacterium]